MANHHKCGKHKIIGGIGRMLVGTLVEVSVESLNDSGKATLSSHLGLVSQHPKQESTQ